MPTISLYITSTSVTLSVIVFLHLFIVQHWDPYFHFVRNTFIWIFEFNHRVYTTEKFNIIAFGKKQHSDKLISGFDSDFLMINSTIQSDALVGFISDKISKQLPVVMLPPAKHCVLNLPETHEDSLELIAAWFPLSW